MSWVFSAGLFVIGAALLAGGAVLASLHGSWYYLACGAALVACALLNNRRRAAAVTIYVALLLATVVWAIWEVGSDGWALTPRIVALALLGLGFVRFREIRLRSVTWGFSLALGVIAIGAVLHMAHPRADDPMFRTGFGSPQSPSSASTSPPRGEVASADWPFVGNDIGASRFSDLEGITPENVGSLRLAWTYHTGNEGAALEVTPLKIGRLVYLCTGTNDVIALDAETGEQRWRFGSAASRANAILKACRGVAYFRAGDAGPCAERIFTNTTDARLIALDARTGVPCAGFGSNGQVSLLKGMGDWRGRLVPGYYFVTSAPTIVRGRIIVGGWVSDAQYWGEPSGVIRAFDALTGRFVWAFDMGRPDRKTEPPDGEQYTPSTPNAWAPMSADEELGLVYVPTGNTSGSDYYGVLRRPFDEHYSSSIVAIDAATGSVRWSFQTVHHDLWDYDVAAQPVLTDIERGSQRLHALIQATKTGEIFVLDRASGTPLFPVHEVPAPARGALPAERLSPTQPASIGLPALRGPDLEERDMWGLTPLDQMWCRIRFRQARYEGLFTPPGMSAFIQYPGILGGVEWSSVAVDPRRSVLIVNASRVANYARLIPRSQADAEGRKPEGFGGSYGQRAQAGTPYAISNPFFLSPLAVPCQNPPFGTISAVNISTGRLIWTRRLGSARDSGPLGVGLHLPFPVGTPNLGGTLLTRTGLAFIAAGQDRILRAFLTENGRLMWEQRLPAASVATPMTYRSPDSGRQFVVVAAGNADPRLGTVGDAIVAYSLPR